MKYILIPLWRIWFYVLIALTILLLFPFLIISILKRSWYPFFFSLARIWATVILYGTGFFPKITKEQTPRKNTSYMFVANHTSMTDIMLMLYTVRNPFVFVGKKELGKIPLFGFFYKRTSILVDRGNSKSRQQVFEAAQSRINEGLSICIFPEGGIPANRNLILDEFKDGAFRLSVEHQLVIVPITFYDNKKRFSYHFFSGGPGIMRAKIHRFIIPKRDLGSRKHLKESVRNVLLNELIQDLK